MGTLEAAGTGGSLQDIQPVTFTGAKVVEFKGKPRLKENKTSGQLSVMLRQVSIAACRLSVAAASRGSIRCR